MCILGSIGNIILHYACRRRLIVSESVQFTCKYISDCIGQVPIHKLTGLYFNDNSGSMIVSFPLTSNCTYYYFKYYLIKY